MADAEIWNEVPRYEGIYKASSHGRVRSQVKILKPSVRNDGYHKYSLAKDGKKRDMYCHRIVMAAFHGISELQVNHIDGSRQNNNIQNLEYVTCRENIAHYRGKSGKMIGTTKCRNRWQAVIYADDSYQYLGTFGTEKEAHEAYKSALKKYGLENKYV